MAPSNPLDMALDDVISQSGGHRRRNTRNDRGGISKPRPSGGPRSPYSNGSRYNDRSAPLQRSSVRAAGNTIVVANLDYNVTEADLYELFGQIGPLKRAFLHLAPSGGSSGVADVVFSNPRDAERAISTYNNVELDGRPMRISYAELPKVQASVGGAIRRPMRSSDRQGPRGGFRNGSRNGPRSGPRDGRRRDNKPKPSVEDLDADMDNYMSSTAVPTEDVAME